MELKTYSLSEIEMFLFYESFSGIIILFSIFGILLFFFQKKNKIILFLPFIFFSFLTLTNGIRFLIFCAPFLYFGLFYFFIFFLKIIKKKYFIKLENFSKIFIFFFVIFIWKYFFYNCSNFVFNCKFKYPIEPYFNTKLVKGLIKLNESDNNYNVISSLDYGYLIDYYTNSEFELHPGEAFHKKKYKFFYSNLKLPENLNNLPIRFWDKSDNENYVFLSYDFIDWWPTIAKMYAKESEGISQILKFSCKEKSNLNLICESSDGVFSLINLNNGYIGNSNLIYKIIINSKSNYIEKILNEDGKAIIVYTPDLKYQNLYAIFPKKYANSFFIKHFFSKVNNNSIELIDDGWPIYRTYKLKK